MSKHFEHFVRKSPVSILYKSIVGRYRPVRVADGPITARCRFIKNDSWEPADCFGFLQFVASVLSDMACLLFLLVLLVPYVL